jgi:hypothetical protein
VKQKKPEQDGDANRNKEQRSDIQRCQSCGETAPMGRSSRRASAFMRSTPSVCHRFDKRRRFCKSLAEKN